jgi:hypothetical protein
MRLIAQIYKKCIILNVFKTKKLYDYWKTLKEKLAKFLMHF